MIANKKILFILSMILILSMTGCGNSKEGEEQDENPVPRELQSIENNIEDILASLSDPSLSEKDREENKSEGKQESESESDKPGKGSKEEDNSSSSQKGGENKQGEQGNQMNEGQKKEDDQQFEGAGGSKEDSGESDKEKDKPKDPKESEQKQSKKNWEDIDKSIKEIHSVWNSYLPKTVKDGVSSDLTEEFSNTLNELTRLSLQKDNARLLLAMNELYSFIPDALVLYDAPVHPGVKKARYYARSVIYNANIGDWVKATDDVEQLDSVWSSTMNVVGKKHKEEVEKLNYAIKDMIKVTEMQSKQLVFIKGEITMSNIKDIEKTLEDQAKEDKAKQEKSKM